MQLLNRQLLNTGVVDASVFDYFKTIRATFCVATIIPVNNICYEWSTSVRCG